MSKVEPYWPEEIVGTGELVVYAQDYATLEAECSRLRAALGQYADDNNWRYDTCNISRDVAKDALAAGGGCI